MAPLMTLEDALHAVLQTLSPVAEHQQIPVFDANGRVLASDVPSCTDVPPLDMSAMDGYAVRAADVAEPGAVLTVTRRIAAGQVGAPLQAGEAARIFTGAPVPPGADAVVMQERCVALDQGQVRIDEAPRAGQHIRRRAEEVAQGDVVMRAGQRVTPAAMGLLASVGQATVAVRRRVRVAVLSTGDELAMPGEPLRPGAIYNSNRFLLRGLLQDAQADWTDLGIVADELQATRAALREAARDHDVVLTTGGVSVGEEDHLKAALQAEGELGLWQVAIKPGKPFAFGAIRCGEAGSVAHFMGLPGNPVAAFVTFLLLVRPALARLAGHTTLPGWPARPHVAGFDWTRPDPKRREFLRARRTADGSVQIYPQQGSALLSSAAWADGLVDLAAGQCVQAGDTVPFVPFSELWG